MIGTLKNKGASCICYERPHPQRHARTHQLEENENKSKLRPHIPHLPSYSGEFDPKVYVNWEMEVDKEFRKFELSEEQKVTIASMVLTNYALNLWTHLARHDKVPKTWKDMKRIFRKECVPEYYADYLLAKLNNLKQGDNSIETYYHNLKFHIMRCGLEECEEATENRFLRGLKTEIQDMLLHETYNSLSCLIELASKIEIQLALSEETIAEPSPTCENKNCIDEMPLVVCSVVSNLGQNKKDLTAHPIKEESEKGKYVCAELNHVNEETHSLNVAPCESINLVLNLSTSHASLEQSLVEPSAVFPLLQDDYTIVPCDREELCDHASLISLPQLVHGHENSILNNQPAEVRRVHCITSEEDELQIISSLNCLGYIEFDLSYDLNSFEDELFWKSGLQYLDYCTFHALGLYDNNNSYIVQKVYICSDLTTSFMVPIIAQNITCIEANNTISSFSPVDHTLQVNFQEGEPSLLHCASVDVLDLCSNRFEKALLLKINDDAKPRTVCSQEGEKGIEWLNIKFTLARDVFESRTLQKQGEKDEDMLESRTTQMQEGENDEDIINMDTPTVVAYDSKVKPFFSIIIFNTCDEWALHHDMCSMSFTEVLTWMKEGVDHAWKAWRMKQLDWGPNTSVPYVPTRSPRYLWHKETERPSVIRFGKADSDSRNSPHENRHPDHIRTPFWTFFIWMES